MAYTMRPDTSRTPEGRLSGHARYCPDRVGGDWEFREPKGGKSRPVAIPETSDPDSEGAQGSAG
jgi:hypothetical protein